MRYMVVKDFKDLMDNGHVYKAGDVFPRLDLNVDESRIHELSTKNNKRGEVLIEPVPEEAPEKKKRGRKNVRTDPEGD